MNVNAGHERTSKARIIHQIQLIRGITHKTNDLTYIFVKSVTEENWQRMGKTVITLSPVTRTPGRI
ncbi:hypothetical protein [Shigella dysenteriae]|nr:hypothetical protein [Shigella dysenteriae]WNT51192.1 hypothetical protein PWP84_01650 [Shigella dysenteriae]